SVSIFYARTTGIWQTVWLEPVESSHLQKARITAHTDGSVSVAVHIARPKPSQRVTIAISRDGKLCATGTSLAEEPWVEASAQVVNPELWSPDSPQLYDLRIELHGPEGLLDAVNSYFGFRSVAAQGGRVLLNGQPIYLRTVLDQGYWPES